MKADGRFQSSTKGKQVNIKPSNNLKTQFKDDEIKTSNKNIKKSYIQENMGMQINTIGYYFWPFTGTNKDNFKHA